MNALKRHHEIGRTSVDLLQHARLAYEHAAALNARHRERSNAAAAYSATVDAITSLGRVMAQLRLLVEPEPRLPMYSDDTEMPRLERRPAGSGGGIFT